MTSAFSNSHIAICFNEDKIIECGYPFCSARYTLESAGFGRLVQMNELVRGQMSISTTKQAHSKLGQVVAPQRFTIS